MLTHVGVVVVIVFEHAITFDREVHFAWGRKPSWARCIFLLNRYLSIMEYLVVLGPLLPTVNTFVSVPGLHGTMWRILTQLYRGEYWTWLRMLLRLV